MPASSWAMRSLTQARAVMPKAMRAANRAVVPVFSVKVRHMSIPRPTWDKELKDLDPEVYKIIQMEQSRQHRGIALIPSENYTTHAVSQVRMRLLARPSSFLPRHCVLMASGAFKRVRT